VRVLVTGGAGFIGSHVVDQLVDDGHEVRVLDALLPLAHQTHADHLNPDARYLFAALGDRAALTEAIDGIDAVLHHAAMVGLGVEFSDTPAYAANNDLGTAQLLAALAARRFRGRIVLASSMVVYGEGRYACSEHGVVAPEPRTAADLAEGRFDPLCPACGSRLTPEPVPESAPASPRNVYAATKLHQEHLCECFARETGATLTALRYHNVYGPRMPRDTPYAGVASLFASSLASGSPPRVFEDGRQLRDFVHVRDVARANLLALTGRPGTFNVASGTPRSVGTLAGTLADAFGPAAPRPIITGEFRLGDVRHVFASAELARELLGFSAEEPFADGVATLLDEPIRAPA